MALDLKDPEVKAAIKEAVDAATDEATSGLVAKNKELLAKMKKLQADAVVDPAEHSALMADKSELETKLSEANKAIKKLGGDLETTRKAHETESQYVQRLLVDNGLTEALTQNGVTNPVRLKAVRAMLSGQVAIKTEGDSRTAVVGDKPLKDYIKDWVAGDEGKYFADAAYNTGGGAQGGGNGGGQGQQKLSRTEFEALGPIQKSGFMHEVKAGKAVLTE